MAAKVVMVAVPTVLGLASIRVYRVSEVPADGLVTREKLNVYDPLWEPAQVHYVPETPGLIESGLTAVRESLLPVATTVQGACVSVKRQSVNMYHTGQDVYYYLKDPPPDFLPRFGTITMAGLLGMFLARKGSHWKRLAIPLGLMSAGASVCYPAQAVAVVKVTSRKVYGAGQWSGSALSSLFTPKPKEPEATDVGASQPESVAVSSPEPAAVQAPEISPAISDGSFQSATMPETEVESAESAPASDEAVNAVITAEASSVTEISHDQAPTDTNTEPAVKSVLAETESALPSEELPALGESLEPSETKQDLEGSSVEVIPEETTANVESETAESSVVQTAEAEAVPSPEQLPESVDGSKQAPEAVSTEVIPEVTTTSVESEPSAEAEAVPSSEEPPAPVDSSEPSDTAPEDMSNQASPAEISVSVEPERVEAAAVQPAEMEAAPPSEEQPAPVESIVPSDTKQASEEVLNEGVPAESTASVEPETGEAAPVQSAAVMDPPSSEEPPAVTTSEEQAADPEPTADQTVEETQSPTVIPPPLPEQAAADTDKGGSTFKPDPSLMDFGQSNPEDEDLYSTRS